MSQVSVLHVTTYTYIDEQWNYDITWFLLECNIERED
jgi:hypothetical protein